MIKKLMIGTFVALILLTLSLPVYAGVYSVGLGDENLYIMADYACYKYSDNVSLTYTEIYYGLMRSQFSFIPENEGYSAIINMFIEIKSDSGVVVDSSRWTIGNWIGSISEAEIANYMVNDAIKAQLYPGSYNITLQATDSNSGKTGHVKFSLVVPSFSNTALDISQIEMIYKIDERDGGNFDKAGKKLIPNIRGNYSHDDSIVYFYAEVYNLLPNQGAYTVTAQVYDANGSLYKELPPMTQVASANSEVILNGFNIDAFKVGVYKLYLTATAGDIRVAAEKLFEITPGKYELELAKEKEQLADFPEASEIKTEEDAKNFRNEILYIANRDELKQYDLLPMDAKNRFAISFWQRRDPTPGTPINEYKIEHYERYKYTNEAFSTFMSPDAEPNGWRSDRGRVYIEYGPPDDIENHPSAMENIPWVQWDYFNVMGQGGVYFIFIEETGYGNYRLIHSTAQGEPTDEDWESRITPSSTD